MTIENLEAEVMALPRDAQAILLLRLLKHLGESREIDPEVASSWSEEAQKRDREMDSGKVTGISAQQVFDKKRGKELYENVIRAQVETPENIGKIISINVETGEYEIGEDLVVTSGKLKAKQPNAIIWAERIGFDAVYAVGGTLASNNVVF
ncbi:addiction module protein [Kamptonema sp. UHCC 0994]|uniref:addiction module protein n=1 Tax=Kamptonema sp. UHCC 0994 TaxID=3031329 RepID=UPI0023BAB117|nr:addiction module protein [Kamptonema sp. UHCC 0994]MDF0556515.1 addiction module protein [Kamptonema sp. UHCC 0994]